jgi:hypothetical protein
MPIGAARLGWRNNPPLPEEFTIEPIVTEVGEGETITFVINTKYFYGSSLYWTVRTTSGNVTASDIVNGTISGTAPITLTGNIGGSSFTLGIVQDNVTEGNETFVIDLRKDSITGPVVATSSGVTISDYIPLEVSWSTTQSGILAAGGWIIENNGRDIRFVIENSQNCGGTNANVQSGTATATITTGTQGYKLNPVLSGLGEAESPGFENMTLTLNGTDILSSTSAGGQLGCAANVPVVQTVLVQPPYNLLPNTTNSFVLTFTTRDALFHVNAFYLLSMTFELL